MTQQQPVPQQQYAAQPEEGGVKGALTRQIGPLQAWQWGAIVVGAYLIWRYVHGSGSGTTSAPAFVPSSDPGTTGSTGAPGPNPIPNPGITPPGTQPPTTTPPSAQPPATPPPPRPTSTPAEGQSTTSVHIPAPTTTPISSKPASAPPSPSLTGTQVHLPLALPISGQQVYKTKAGGTRVVNTPKVPGRAVRSGQLYEGGPTAKKPVAPKRPAPKRTPTPKHNTNPVKL